LVKVLIPTALQRFADNRDEVEVEAGTVAEALQQLNGVFPDLRRHLFTDDGALRTFVNVYINNEDMRSLQGLETPLEHNTELAIVPSIAGGIGVIDDARRDAQSLSPEEIRRYSRHLIMPEVAMEGQKKLRAAKVLCIGAGGLGSPLAMYLAAAGVGTIGIVDFDVVDYTNLQRQIIHGTEDVGKPKMESAKETLRSINPYVEVIGYETALTSENALDIIRSYDIVIDGTDNFPTRYLVNDACVLLGKPNVYGSIFRFDGQASVFWAEHGPCYRCLYPEPPPPGLVPSCAEGGVLGILPGEIGIIQATEAVKLILGIGEPLIGRLLLFNALKMQWRELKLRKDPECPICGTNPTITELIDYEAFCGMPQAEVEPETVQDNTSDEISVHDLKEIYSSGRDVVILDVREPHEWDICRLPNTLLMPMSEIQTRYKELDPNAEIVIHCRSGVRSLRALEFLRDEGFKNLKSVKGGILAWSEEIDPSVPQY
jgi:adenylyltransferase/sulfurtransferase